MTFDVARTEAGGAGLPVAQPSEQLSAAGARKRHPQQDPDDSSEEEYRAENVWVRRPECFGPSADRGPPFRADCEGLPTMGVRFQFPDRQRNSSRTQRTANALYVHLPNRELMLCIFKVAMESEREVPYDQRAPRHTLAPHALESCRTQPATCLDKERRLRVSDETDRGVFGFAGGIQHKREGESRFDVRRSLNFRVAHPSSIREQATLSAIGHHDRSDVSKASLSWCGVARSA